MRKNHPPSNGQTSAHLACKRGYFLLRTGMEVVAHRYQPTMNRLKRGLQDPESRKCYEKFINFCHSPESYGRRESVWAENRFRNVFDHLSSDEVTRLKQEQLLDFNGLPCEQVRRIVMAAVEHDGDRLKLVDPLATHVGA